MTFHSGEAHAEQQDDIAETLLPIIESLVTQLADGFDHPDIWVGLANAAQFDDISDFRVLLGKLRQVASDPRVVKAAEIMYGLLHALSVDRGEGIGFLTALAHKTPHCPQIAGALFFVERHGDTTRSADLSNRFAKRLLLSLKHSSTER